MDSADDSSTVPFANLHADVLILEVVLRFRSQAV